MAKHKSLCLPIFRHKYQTGPDRLARISQAKSFPLYRDATGCHWVHAGNSPHQLGPPRPDNAGNPKNLTGAN